MSHLPQKPQSSVLKLGTDGARWLTAYCVVGEASSVLSWNLEGEHMLSAVWVSPRAYRSRHVGESKAWTSELNSLELKDWCYLLPAM